MGVDRRGRTARALPTATRRRGSSTRSTSGSPRPNRLATIEAPVSIRSSYPAWGSPLRRRKLHSGISSCPHTVKVRGWKPTIRVSAVCRCRVRRRTGVHPSRLPTMSRSRADLALRFDDDDLQVGCGAQRAARSSGDRAQPDIGGRFPRSWFSPHPLGRPTAGASTEEQSPQSAPGQDHGARLPRRARRRLAPRFRRDIWKVVRGAGRPPPGIRLDRRTGVLSGKARRAGSSTFTIEVLDAKSASRPPVRDTAMVTLTLVVS